MYFEDGFCDDALNIYQCNYDGGDCCINEPDTYQYCTECQCKCENIHNLFQFC